MPKDTATLLDEYGALVDRQGKGQATPEELQRLELLRDVLLELGALDQPQGKPPRGVRKDAAMEVSFSSRDQVVKAYSQDIGAGGIALKTAEPLPVGSTLKLRIRFPDEGPLITTDGTVAWSKSDSMGVSFEKMREADAQRIKALLLEDASFLRRVRSVLATDVRDIGAKAELTPIEARPLDTRPLTVVALADAKLAALTVEVLRQRGVRATDGAAPERPVVVVVDGETALTSVVPGAALIMINVSGPDALGGKLVQLKPTAYVKRPASAAAIAQAVSAELAKRFH